MVRLFIGVTLPEDVKSDVADFQDSLNRLPMRAKLVERDNLHVSMTFLGETDKDRIPEISTGLDAACRGHKPFTARVGGVLMIPNWEYLRVIALDVRSVGDAVESLRKDIVGAVGGDSHPAHLTLARVREVTNKGFVRDFLGSKNIEKYFEVSSVFLLRSVGKRTGGRVYEVVHETKLQ